LKGANRFETVESLMPNHSRNSDGNLGTQGDPAPDRASAQETARGEALKGRYYPETRFGGYTDLDDTVLFYTRINTLLRPGNVVVDIGCGRGRHRDDPISWRRELRIFKGKCDRVIGIDVDPEARSNPFLDEFHLLEGSRAAFPLIDASADICFADFVVEHVIDPVSFFSECHRVLKPGGHLCIRTTNALSYLGLASQLIPNRLHTKVLEWVQPGRQSKDVFPTAYKANTRRRLARLLRTAGFDACVYAHEPEPAYLSSSRVAYLLGVLHQRYAPRAVGPTLLAFARKLGS
jgi:SAM-dependent methyltransferase